MIKIIHYTKDDSGSWKCHSSEGWGGLKLGGDPKDGSDGDDGA